jgi:AraC-like DNA-binding protein
VAGKMADMDMNKLLHEFGITPAMLNDHHAHIRYPIASSLRRQVLSTIKNDAFALLVGEKLPIVELGIVDYICTSSPSVSSAMNNLSRYFRLIAHPDFAVSYEEKNNSGLINYGQQGATFSHQTIFEQQSTEFTFSITISRIRAVVKTRVNPVSVSFRHAPPSYVDEYERIFQAPISFNSENNVMILGEDSLGLSPDHQEHNLHHILKTYAETSVSSLPDISGIANLVLQELKKAFHHGEPTAESIANKLFMSPRTLHRKLKQENTSFAGLRDQLRCELAQSMLGNHELSVTDISFLLGFSQPSAFNRAFKRWNGITPQSFRDQSPRQGHSIIS